MVRDMSVFVGQVGGSNIFNADALNALGSSEGIQCSKCSKCSFFCRICSFFYTMNSLGNTGKCALFACSDLQFRENCCSTRIPRPTSFGIIWNLKCVIGHRPVHQNRSVSLCLRNKILNHVAFGEAFFKKKTVSPTFQFFFCMLLSFWRKSWWWTG